MKGILEQSIIRIVVQRLKLIVPMKDLKLIYTLPNEIVQ